MSFNLVFYDGGRDSGVYITARQLGNGITTTVSCLSERFHFSTENNFKFALVLLDLPLATRATFSTNEKQDQN